MTALALLVEQYVAEAHPWDENQVDHFLRWIGDRNLDLTFAEVHAVNRARCARWHPGFPADETWTTADWSNAMLGEVGEVAEVFAKFVAHAGLTGNLVKKLRRHEAGHASGALDRPLDEIRQELAKEMADVFLYLDLLATKLDVDLLAAIPAKFNEVSIRQGFPERLPMVVT